MPVGDAFRPNHSISPNVFKILILGEAIMAIAAWWLLPLQVIPKPAEVVRALGNLWMEGLGRELIISFTLNLEAIFWTLAISLALSYLTVLPAFRPIAAALSKGRFLGLIGLTLIFTLTVGGGHELKLSLLVFGMSVFFITSMVAVITELPKEKFDHARTLGMNEWRVVWEVVVLGTADEAFEVLRQNAAIGWMMLTMVEGISRAEGGVGAMLLNQNKHFHLAEVFAIQIVILVVGILQDYAIGLLRRLFCPYAELVLERK
ncbi:MAG TPA: nitrate ABC transporter permease [Thermoanaerobaculia bacterium]|nr:nitrate ABC transporter permease [Thermoanaerobaculia bacterium]